MKQLFSLYAACALLVFATGCDKYKDRISPANQEKVFIKYFGHVYSQKAADIKQLPDKGYILFGSTTSFVASGDRGTYNNYYLVRTDSLGNELWSKQFGNSLYDDVACRVILLPGGGFLLAGTRQKIEFQAGANQYLRKQKRIYLLETDKDGLLVRDKIHAARGVLEADEVDYQVNDLVPYMVNGELDGYILTGFTTNVNRGKPNFNPDIDELDLYTARIKLDLSSPWDRTYGFQGNDIGVSVDLGKNVIIVTGSTETYPGNSTTNPKNEIRVVKYEPANGGIIAQVAYSDPAIQLEAFDACYDTTKQVLTMLCGSSSTASTALNGLAFMQATVPDNLGSNDIVRLQNTNPVILTNGTSKNAGSNSVGAYIELYPNDNGFLVTSTSIRSVGINSDVHLMRLDKNLSVQWDWLFGAGATLDVAGRAFTMKDNGGNPTGYALTGTFDLGTNEMIGLVKVTGGGSLTIQ